jgi:glycosyltransferase involved in cell wall biosynthesis
MRKNPKLSILIPVKNGMPYLGYAIDSVLKNSRDDYEILVSVDTSVDGSLKHVENVAKVDKRLKVVIPPNGLTMSEHWDFLQLHAQGEWQFFLGQDDLMKNGYEHEISSIIEVAKKSDIEVVVARRAYVNWNPLNSNKIPSIQYWKTDDYQILDSKRFIQQALFSTISYHEGPQMYTSSIVHKNVINEVREENAGKLILGHPQDAFLAAIFLKHRPRYLFWGRPFSFVGTSLKSAGLAISTQGTDSSHSKELASLASEYQSTIRDSKLGDADGRNNFSHGSAAMYFYLAVKTLFGQKYLDQFTNNFYLRLKFDLNFLLSKPELRISSLHIQKMTLTKLSTSHSLIIRKFLEAYRYTISFFKLFAASLFRNFLYKRIHLRRIMGPMDEQSILFEIKSI